MEKYGHNFSGFTTLEKTNAWKIFVFDGCYFKRKNSITGFTLIELLVVIGIISLLMAIAMPVATLARDIAKTTACKSNLKSLGVGFRMYLDDHDLTMPIASRLPSAQLDKKPAISKVLNPYLQTNEVFRCPADIGQQYFLSEGSSYEYNSDIGGQRTDSSWMARRGAKEINIQVMYDYKPFHGKKIAGKPGSVNYLYADGHVSDLRNQNE